MCSVQLLCCHTVACALAGADTSALCLEFVKGLTGVAVGTESSYGPFRTALCWVI